MWPVLELDPDFPLGTEGNNFGHTQRCRIRVKAFSGLAEWMGVAVYPLGRSLKLSHKDSFSTYASEWFQLRKATCRID